MASILIVDDDPVYSEMTKQRLERAGHRVIVHSGPFGASAAARRADIDLVILDVFMPGLSGPDLLAVMRQRSESKALVIFCSSMDPQPLAKLAAEHGADGWIPKSAPRNDIVQYIASQLVPEMLKKRPSL